jgi:tetratricopeptide (TPR) repeat protein
MRRASLLLAAIAIWACEERVERPSREAKETLGNRAFRDGLTAYKEARYEAAAQMFDTARQNLLEPSDAEDAFRATQRTIAEGISLAEARRAFVDGRLADVLELTATLDEGSRFYDEAEAMRAKVREALKILTDAAAEQLETGVLWQASADVNRALAIDPRNEEALRLRRVVDERVEEDRFKRDGPRCCP